ncbi:hypothetical protein C8T65DRAFT_551628, partial [Cerioporus squamosus]
IKRCLALPRITSITFTSQANAFTVYEPPSALNAIATAPLPLTGFAYIRPFWREKRFRVAILPIDTHFEREEKWLSALIPGMASTLMQLTVPMETSLISAMASLSWPALQDLSIRGRYWSEEQKDALPQFLSSIPRLRKLSVTVCRRGRTDRPPILGSSTVPHPTIAGLRSLTVAYPDPADNIFSIDATRLRHLSLCDAPRFYCDLSQDETVSSGFARPILHSAECLSILRRMDMPELSNLELVYLANTAGSDDELLSYVIHTFPHLSHLELHRYRANRDEVVDYVHITKLLTGARNLRSVRLNLDFHDDHGPHTNAGGSVLREWRITFRERRGPEIVAILEACPWLEDVELLYHAWWSSRWAKF